MSTWYRPPQSFPDLFMNFERVIDKTDAENFELYLLGELNCDLLPDSVNFFYFFFYFYFFIYLQHFTDPTSYINHLGTEN